MKSRWDFFSFIDYSRCGLTIISGTLSFNAALGLCVNTSEKLAKSCENIESLLTPWSLRILGRPKCIIWHMLERMDVKEYAGKREAVRATVIPHCGQIGWD